MSYSEVSGMVEVDGYAQTMQFIYTEYRALKAKYEELKQKADRAKQELETMMNQADYLIQKGARDKVTIQEDGCHVLRMIVGNEVVHFRKPDNNGDTFYIGYWPLSEFPDGNGH